MRILIVEDDKNISAFLKSSLEAENFVADTAEDGEKGSYLARTNDYDLIILDYVMPKKDGLAVCQELRALNKTVPILMLSVKAEIPDRVKLLNVGVDDYVAKPFSFHELLARIRAILRRPRLVQNNPLKFADLVLDSERQMVWKGKKEIYLTRKEFLLLEYFMKNAGRVLSRGLIMEHVWSIDGDPFSNTIEAHILNLRRKVDDGKKKLIHTVPGRGYKLDLKK
ncbi:MAG TPA: response regulator transcription factor [Candidatus Paceibacterota bacterium]|nr:response regulator transcription factor [Candidatus Paceibacterota bacterium]